MDERKIKQYARSVLVADDRGHPPPVRYPRAKVGRNAPCPFCASGKKFKHCCLGKTRAKPVEEAETCPDTPSSP